MTNLIRYRGNLYRRQSDTLSTDTDEATSEMDKQKQEWARKELDPSHPASKDVKPVRQYPREKILTPEELRAAKVRRSRLRRYRMADIENERRKLAEPVLRLIYEDITDGNVKLDVAQDNVDDYIEATVDEALKTPSEYFDSPWDLLRDVLEQAAREELIRSTKAGVEANWDMLEEWMEVEKEGAE